MWRGKDNFISNHLHQRCRPFKHLLELRRRVLQSLHPGKRVIGFFSSCKELSPQSLLNSPHLNHPGGLFNMGYIELLLSRVQMKDLASHVTFQHHIGYLKLSQRSIQCRLLNFNSLVCPCLAIASVTSSIYLCHIHWKIKNLFFCIYINHDPLSQPS